MPLDITNLTIARNTLGRNKAMSLPAALAALASPGPAGGGIQPPFVFAHRGTPYQAPENSLAGWDIAAAAGFPLEGDWRLSSDNALVAMHDATVDRTTTSSGNVTAFTLAQFQAMDNGTKWSPLYATERVPSFEQYIQRYPNAWLVPECSNATLASAMKMARTLQAYDAESRSILQMFENSPYPILGAVKAACPSLYVMALALTGGPAPNLDTAAAAGIDWIGVDINSAWVNADWVLSAQSRGLRVIFYTIDDYASLTLALSYGCDAIFSGRPFAMRRLARMAASPPSEMWTGQNRAMFGDDWFLSNMTAFNASGCRPNNGNAGNDLTTLLGGVVLIGRPLPAAATTWQLKFNLTCTALNGDPTRWFGIQFGLQQDGLVINFAPCDGSGMQVIVRQNGSLEIARCVLGVASATLATQASTGLVVGTAVPFVLDVTPTQITLTRTDTAASVTFADATYRAGLLGMMWSNLAARIGPLHGS
jgi:glycerophosphoryl diester phosphodiesterase